MFRQSRCYMSCEHYYLADLPEVRWYQCCVRIPGYAEEDDNIEVDLPHRFLHRYEALDTVQRLVAQAWSECDEAPLVSWEPGATREKADAHVARLKHLLTT